MDALEFIQKDISRARSSSRPFIIMGLVLFLLPIVLGIGLREDNRGIFDPRIMLPNLAGAFILMAVLISGYSKNWSSRSVFAWGALGIALGLFLATERIFFPPGMRTIYTSNEEFWHESARCFIKGGFTTVIAGLCLSLFAFGISSWPSRRWRIFLSFSAGAIGAVMLGFHCDSSSVGHVALGHVGQGLIFGLIIFIGQEIFFHAALKRRLPILMEKIKNPSRIG